MTDDNRLKSYWSHEIAKLLDISTSSLRRWSIELEAIGYSFIRDENNKRAYLQSDIMPLQKMRELLTEGMSLESAANAVVLRFSEQISNSRANLVCDKNNRLSDRLLKIESSLEFIEQWIQKQQVLHSQANPVCNEFERSLEHSQQIQLSLEQLQQQMLQQQSELLLQLKLQQQYIEHSLNLRDELLLHHLRSSLEAKKEVASAQQKRWWKFWT